MKLEIGKQYIVGDRGEVCVYEGVKDNLHQFKGRFLDQQGSATWQLADRELPRMVKELKPTA
jgi:hypothetical protein